MIKIVGKGRKQGTSSQSGIFNMQALIQILFLLFGTFILVFMFKNPSVQALDQDTSLSRANASFVGEEVEDGSGYTVSGAGDVNNDGYGDVLIGAPLNDEGGRDAGKTYLILGRADMTAWNDSDPLDLSYANASFIGEEVEEGSSWSAVGVGDVNSDGYGDILIGAPFNDEGGRDAGKTCLILGRADVTAWNGTDPLDLSYANASFIGEEVLDKSGSSVSGAGDVNNDGFADILIGAFMNDEGSTEAGKTYLILGRTDVAAWNGTDPLDLSYANASFIGEDVNDNSGLIVSGAGDVNNDGFADILISAPMRVGPDFLLRHTCWNNNNRTICTSTKQGEIYSAGQTYLILGRADVMAWNGGNPLDLSYANASFIGEMEWDESGSSLAGAGDVNNDGFADILIGAAQNDEGGDGAGKTYLVLGRADVTAWNSSKPLNLSYANASFIGEKADDASGWSVAGTGDVNNDGFADILIGAIGNAEGEGPNAGQTYLMLGRADVTAWNGSNPLDLSYANASFIGEEAGEQSGKSVAGAGDVNNDGFADILIGAPHNDEAGYTAGQTYLLLGTLIPIAQQLQVNLQAIAADNLTIEVAFVVKDYYGNSVDSVQIWVSNGTYAWMGTTNHKGQFNVSFSYTMVPFSLEVNVTKDSYTSDRETFVIFIEPAAVKHSEPVSEFNGSVLIILGLLGFAIVGFSLVIRQKRELQNFLRK